MSQENNNGFLYFAVGGLLVAILAIGYLYTQSDGTNDTTAVIERTVDGDDNPDFELEMNEDGFKASSDRSDN